jgi:hypothetical protein
MGGNDDRFDLEEMNSSSSASDQYHKAIESLAQAVYGCKWKDKNVAIETLMNDATYTIERLTELLKETKEV